MKSQFHRHCALAAILLSATATLTPLFAAEPASPAALPDRSAAAGPAIYRYQLALDQLAQGDITSARLLAEAARKSYGDSPEINMLLAYLLQREGRLAEAQEALEPVRNASPLASAQALQLPGLTAGGATSNTARPAFEEPAMPAPAATPVAATSKTVASLPQPDARLKTLEAYLAGKVNEERRKAGLTPLTTDSLLADTSRAHSAEMRDRKYFAHESPTESLREPLDRYRAVFKDTPSIVAENIYRSWGSPRRITQKEIDAGHEALMKSPGHRSNILMRDVRRIGIGIVANSTGDFWVTEMFARD